MNMYEEPNVKVVRFNGEDDVLTASGELGIDWDSTWLNDVDFN